MLKVRKQFVCVDGTTLSVQASSTHYCIPRNDQGPYTHFEVMCSHVQGDWSVYHDSDDVYSCVPAAEIEQEIARHGGISMNTFYNLAMVC